MVANLMTSLCEHLENTSGFFQVSSTGDQHDSLRQVFVLSFHVVTFLLVSQTQLEENDGVVDMASSHGDYLVHCTNLDMLLKSMATFFAWSVTVYISLCACLAVSKPPSHSPPLQASSHRSSLLRAGVHKSEGLGISHWADSQ